MTHKATIPVVTPDSIFNGLADSYDESIFLASLLEASKRAVRLEREIIVSVQLPIKQFDPLHVFAHLQHNSFGNCFFWQQPAKTTAYIGGGSAYSIEKYGATCFTEVRASLQAVLADAVIIRTHTHSIKEIPLPLFFGGFAFDASRPCTALWDGFPEGLLVLPEFLLCQDEEGSHCIINAVIQPADKLAQHEQNTMAIIKYLDEVTTCVLPHTSYNQTTDATGDLDIHDRVSRSDWIHLLAKTVEQIRAGALQKVVLARGVDVRYKTKGDDIPFDITTVLSRLSLHEPDSCIFAIQRGELFFVGATPERLVHVQDQQLATMALAGTAPRGTSEEEDRYIGTELLASKKNHNEHAIVIDMLRKKLENLCSTVHIAENPCLLKLANVQHLITPITGQLLPGRSILDVVAYLHPTPAVGGLPLQPALQTIREGEDLDRGWYTGPLGWIDAHGSGEFIVALRSALLHGTEATLFAGCGIVADSDPQSEYLESCLKLHVMLRGLGKAKGSV